MRLQTEAPDEIKKCELDKNKGITIPYSLLTLHYIEYPPLQTHSFSRGPHKVPYKYSIVIDVILGRDK